MSYMQNKINTIFQRVQNKKMAEHLVNQFQNWNVKINKPIEFLSNSGFYSGESIPVNMEFKNPQTGVSYQVVVATDSYPERGSFDCSEYTTNWERYKSKVEIHKYDKDGNETYADYKSEGTVYKRSMYTILKKMSPNAMRTANNERLSDNPEFAAIFKCAMMKFYSLDSTNCNSFVRPLKKEFDTSITTDCQLGGKNGIIPQLKTYEYTKQQDQAELPKLEKTIIPNKLQSYSHDLR